MDLQPYRHRIATLASSPAADECTSALLATHNLTIGYKGKDGFTRAIPDLRFRAGEITGLMGNNGCGKTTLVRTLTGLIKPVSGRIELNGVPAKPRDLTRAGFLVMQDVNYQLFSDSVREELLIGLDETDAGITAQANQVMADLDLAAFVERHPMSLSGGQKQRVAIGSALMCGKDLIILDEPTSGLDRYHMEQVGELLRQLASQGKAILVVTHDEELAAAGATALSILAPTIPGTTARMPVTQMPAAPTLMPLPISPPHPPMKGTRNDRQQHHGFHGLRHHRLAR